MYELRCLGEASLRDPSGGLLHFRSRKHFALLTYLALNADRAHRRERLAGLLWSDADDSRARHSLSQALYAVRRLLDGAVRIEGEDLEMEGEGLRVDAIELERLFRAGEARAAADLYRGDFLEGFWLRGAQGFEEWSGREKARVGALAREALRAAIRSARESCEWAEVRSRAERLIQLDPFDEAAYAELMRALWMLGDRAAALERYEVLERVLAAELETAPAPETVALVERIRKRPVRGGWGNRPLLRECENPAFLDPPFVGRKAELAALAEEWARVERGESRTVVLVGDAGIGKTRLAEEFICSLELSDVCVLRGRCYEVEQTLPYGPVAEALREGLDELELGEVAPLWLAELARIVPEVSERVGELPVPAVLDAEGGRRRLYEGIAQVLRAACEARPVLLFVDDLHWADDSSLALLHYLHRRVTNGLYLLTAHRPEELALHDRSRLQIFCSRDSNRRVLQLGGLDPSLSVDILKSILGENPSLIELDNAHRLSGGNPFFTVELARTIAESANDAHVTSTSAPNGIRTILNRRLSRLDQSAVNTLRQASCLGSRCRYELLRLATNISPLDFENIVTQLGHSGLLRRDVEMIAFRHDIIRELVWSDVPRPLRTAFHLRAARALTKSGGRYGEIAAHLFAAGRANRAYGYAVRGADAASRLFALEEEADLLHLAIKCAPNDPTRFLLLGRLGKLYAHIREYSRARPVLKARLEYLTNDRRSRVEILRAKRDLILVDVYSPNCTVEESGNVLSAFYREVRSSGVEEAELEAQILGALLWAAARSFNVQLVEETISHIRALHARTARPDVRWRTARSLGIYECYKGRLDVAEALLREALRFAVHSADDAAILECYIGRTALIVRVLSADLANEVLETALSLARQHADPAKIAAILCNCAVCFMHLRDSSRAEALLRQARETYETAGAYPDTSPSVLYNLGFVSGDRGDHEASEAYWNKALRASEKDGVIPHRQECLAALARLAFTRGDVQGARSLGAEALRLARRGGFLVDDRSILEDLLARLRVWGGKESKALDRLASVANATRNTDARAYFRVQLTRLELLVQLQLREQAEQVGDELRRYADSKGASWWHEQADKLLSEI